MLYSMFSGESATPGPPFDAVALRRLPYWCRTASIVRGHGYGGAGMETAMVEMTEAAARAASKMLRHHPDNSRVRITLDPGDESKALVKIVDSVRPGDVPADPEAQSEVVLSPAAAAALTDLTLDVRDHRFVLEPADGDAAGGVEQAGG